MKKLTLFSIILFLSLNLCAQNKYAYQFKLLRQEEDHAGIAELAQKSFYQKMKHTPIFREGSISFGGSYRGQFEFFDHEEFGALEDGTDGWYLQRFLAHTDLKLNRNFRFFAELGASEVYSKNSPSPVDRDQLYVNQLFLDYQDDRWDILIGRRNAKLGSRRLLDPREGPNVRRSFDGINVGYTFKDKHIQAFYMSPVQPQENIFDNDLGFDQQQFWGLYASKFIDSSFMLDLYYMGNYYSQSEYETGIGQETRHSFGVRQWKDGKWGFDNELIIQMGSFANNDLFAWTVSLNTWANIGKSSRIGIKTELISGDRQGDGLGTFNPLYPRGAYFGRVARFGPANLIDIHPYWTFRKDKFSMELDYDIFWRYSREDAVYGPPMNIVIGGESDERFIAQQFGTIFNYEFNPFFMLELETNHIFIGDLIQESVENAKNLFHMVITAELRF